MDMKGEFIMNKNVLEFYVLANKLKEVIRTGWLEVEISSDRIESVAEHIYGSIILAIALDSEYHLDVDLLKTIKMLIVKELEKVTLKEFTTRDNAEDREAQARETVLKVVEPLSSKEELIGLLDEYYVWESKEAHFVKQLSKIESDIQAKIYDNNGYFDLDKAKEDAKYYGEELSSKIIPKMENASDGWIMYDRKYYKDEMFQSLSLDIQKMR